MLLLILIFGTGPLAQASAPREDLIPFYEEFSQDGEVSFYLGSGYQAQRDTRASETAQKIREQLDENHASPAGWLFDSKKEELRFSLGETRYRVQFGHERDEFQRAFSQYEIVLYHGHSRYGRGPAFGSPTNYFRMSGLFPSLEVESENPYFLGESAVDTDEYPLKSFRLGEERLPYQYRGGRNPTAGLSSASHTKRIRGGDADFQATPFLPGRQIIYFYSCANINYFKKPIRKRFPDPSQKFVFGTDDTSYWGSMPQAVLIADVALGTSASSEILQDLNETRDCVNCFTTY